MLFVITSSMQSLYIMSGLPFLFTIGVTTLSFLFTIGVTTLSFLFTIGVKTEL